MGETRIQLVISAVDNATAKLRNINHRISEMTKPVRDVQRSFSSLSKESGLYVVGNAAKSVGGSISNVGKEAGALATRLGVIGGIAGFAIKRGLIDTAAEFERYSAILETVEGSQAAAKKSLSWVSDFATTTPYELGQVTEAFVRLRAYGMDPTNGLLRTLGDTGSAMGKNLMSAVEAIADAVTGENERLKEFGITSENKGDKTRYSYTDKAGNQQHKVVDKNNRKMIESTLTAIWNEKYAGAMERQSKTWIGMISNIKDQWTRFVTMIMGTGLFDWMRGKLQGVLDRINQLAEAGELQAWAQQIGQSLQAALRDIWAFATETWKAMRQVGAALVWLRDLFGGWRPVVLGIIAIMSGPFLLAMAMAVKAVIALGIALMSTPVGWIIAGIAAVAGAAWLIYKAWDPITKWWDGIINAMGTTVDNMVRRVAKSIAWVKGLLSWLPGMEDSPPSAGQTSSPTMGGSARAARHPIATMGGEAQTARYPMATMGGEVPTAKYSSSADRKAQVGGTIRIAIDSEGRPRVKEIRSTNRDVDFNVDAGLTMRSY